jgi:hypothetical protein
LATPYVSAGQGRVALNSAKLSGSKLMPKPALMSAAAAGRAAEQGATCSSGQHYGRQIVLAPSGSVQLGSCTYQYGQTLVRGQSSKQATE